MTDATTWCPWCGAAVRKATKAEEAKLRKTGEPEGYRLTFAVYERCTACEWTRVSATLEVKP